MGFSTVLRLTLGLLFVCAGSVKITRFGHAIVPDTHKHMAKDFGKFLRVSPIKPYLKITSVQYMHIVGYTELLAGILLLTNNVAALAALVLAVVMVAASYTHYKLKDPVGKVAFPCVLAAACLYIVFNQQEAQKEKKE